MKRDLVIVAALGALAVAVVSLSVVVLLGVGLILLMVLVLGAVVVLALNDRPGGRRRGGIDRPARRLGIVWDRGDGTRLQVEWSRPGNATQIVRKQ